MQPNKIILNLYVILLFLVSSNTISFDISSPLLFKVGRDDGWFTPNIDVFFLLLASKLILLEA